MSRQPFLLSAAALSYSTSGCCYTKQTVKRTVTFGTHEGDADESRKKDIFSGNVDG